jgi:phthalate 4,5-cis-dihydrodiol dehydrogenase
MQGAFSVGPCFSCRAEGTLLNPLERVPEFAGEAGTFAEGMALRKLTMGVAGLGQGAALVLPALNSLPQSRLAGGADPNERMRAGFLERFPAARAFDSIDAMCEDPEIEAIWISTPNRFHCAHAVTAMRSGKHVLVEKPMAVTIEEADLMVNTARECGVHFVAAHTSSYSFPVRAMRKIAAAELGTVRSVFMASYMDWMLRARTPDELSAEAGSGIVHRQGPHQIDVLRLLGGGKLRSVRGITGAWMPERTIPGFYSAIFEFENGTSATILLNGYGYFMAGELLPGQLNGWRYNDDDRIGLRRAMQAGARDEEREKEEFRIGGRRDPTAGGEGHGPKPWGPVDLGLLVVSCDRGDMRHSPYGVYVYGDNGKRDVDLRHLAVPGSENEGGATIGAIGELYDAVVNGVPVYHSGAWGRATLEATLGIVTSAREHREVLLERQVAMPDDYDANLLMEVAR